jgi:hypothetical protein
MNNAEGNEKKEKQNERTAQSPIKEPAAETAHIKAGPAMKGPGSQGPFDTSEPATPMTSVGNERPGPLGMTHHHPRGADVANDDTLDNTVDADGKSREARHDMEMREHSPDAVINSNATLVNYVPSPADGLGGFDSRPARNGLLLALERGFRMIDRGMVAPQVMDVEEKLRYEGRDPHGNTLRGRKHYALNHLRPSRLFEIEGTK